MGFIPSDHDYRCSPVRYFHASGYRRYVQGGLCSAEVDAIDHRKLSPNALRPIYRIGFAHI